MSESRGKKKQNKTKEQQQPKIHQIVLQNTVTQLQQEEGSDREIRGRGVGKRPCKSVCFFFLQNQRDHSSNYIYRIYVYIYKLYIYLYTYRKDIPQRETKMQVQQITKNAIMQQEMDRTNETFSWKRKHHRPIYRCPVASFYLAIKILSFILNITEFA